MQTCARTLAEGIEALDGGLTVKVDLDAAAHIVGCRAHGDVVGGDVDTHGEALLVDVGEVLLRLGRVLMGDVQTDMVQTVDLHLLVDGSCHDVAGGQREAFVVFLHEGLAIGQFQDAAIAAHGLGNEVGGMRLLGVVEHRRVELYEFHVGHCSLGAIDHGDAVAGGDDGIRGGQVDGSATTCTHDGDLRQVGVDLLGDGVEYVGPIALNIRRATSDADAQVMLGDDFDGEVVFLHLDVGTGSYGLHQSALNLGTGIVGMVQDAEF